MALIAKEGQSFDPVPAGVYQGVCYAIYDIGHQYSEKFAKSSHQCIIIWEIPSERIEIDKDGEKVSLPRVISKKYTLSLGDRANLRKDLESWRGRTFTPDELKGFDLHKLVGVNCMIQVIHKTSDGKTYANISAILPLYKGMAKLEPENPTVVFALGGEIPFGTPKWILGQIHNSQEWKDFLGHEPSEEFPPVESYDGNSDEIPF